MNTTSVFIALILFAVIGWTFAIGSCWIYQTEKRLARIQLDNAMLDLRTVLEENQVLEDRLRNGKQWANRITRAQHIRNAHYLALCWLNELHDSVSREPVSLPVTLEPLDRQRRIREGGT
jgi:hypothetical protein